MRAAALALLAALLAALVAAEEPPLPEGNAYVRSLLDVQRHNEEVLDRYTYDVLSVREELDATGRVKERQSRLHETFHVKGRRVRRLVAENGRPLSPERQAREDRTVREQVEAVRQGKVVTERPGLRLSEIIARYDFRTVGREVVSGRPALVFDFLPRPGKRSIDGDAVLRRLTGRIFVDEAERVIVRAELHNLETIKLAWGLGASVSSVTSHLEFRKVDDTVWLPHEEETVAVGRMLLFKGFRTRMRRTYSAFRHFDVDVEEEGIRPVPSPSPSP